jgi:hypothetical protein
MTDYYFKIWKLIKQKRFYLFLFFTFWYLKLKNIYRVYHIELVQTKWLWGVEGSIILLNYGASWLQEIWKFEFHQPVFKKVTLADLNSLWQKGYQISVKKSIPQKGTSFDHLGARDDPNIRISNLFDEMRLLRSLRPLRLLRL